MSVDHRVTVCCDTNSAQPPLYLFCFRRQVNCVLRSLKDLYKDFHMGYLINCISIFHYLQITHFYFIGGYFYIIYIYPHPHFCFWRIFWGLSCPYARNHHNPYPRYTTSISNISLNQSSANSCFLIQNSHKPLFYRAFRLSLYFSHSWNFSLILKSINFRAIFNG